MPKRLIISIFFAVFYLLLTVTAGARSFPAGTFTLEDSSSSEWDVTFDDDGRYRVLHDGDEVIVGICVITGNRIEFKDLTGPFAEPDKVGSYTWTFSKGRLTFTVVSDDAEGRSQTLTSGPWKTKEIDE